MEFTRVKVLHSRSDLGVPGSVLRVTPERLALLLEQGMVEVMEAAVKKQTEVNKETKPNRRGNRDGDNNRTDPESDT